MDGSGKDTRRERSEPKKGALIVVWRRLLGGLAGGWVDSSYLRPRANRGIESLN